MGICDGFIDDSFARAIRSQIEERIHNDEMRRARIGNQSDETVDTSIRKDKIYWLDRINNDPIENRFLDHVEEYIQYLNRTCFAGITGYEFHYALYEKGSFYKRHIDQFHNDTSRQFSLITYLNDNWQEGDGGELKIYLDGDSSLIPPLQGRAVFFKSGELEHEVLVAHQPRMSVTGWLKVGDPIGVL